VIKLREQVRLSPYKKRPLRQISGLLASALHRATMNSALDRLGLACGYWLVVAIDAWPNVACTK
jgi:hypothetical protein